MGLYLNQLFVYLPLLYTLLGICLQYVSDQIKVAQIATVKKETRSEEYLGGDD